MKIGKISVGNSAYKRYTRDNSFDNNTTTDFGYVQPLYCKMLLPNAKISCKYKQLVRLSPMPVPTFGRMYLRNDVRFVPIGDIWRGFDSFLSNSPMYVRDGVSVTYDKMPQTTNQFLLYFMLTHFARYTQYILGDDGYYTIGTNSPNQFFYRAVFGISPTSSTYYSFPSNSELKGDNYVRIDGADYVFQVQSSSSPAITSIFAFRLTNQGRRMRTNLLGLGYSLQSKDNSKRNLLPLLALYKAWYDTYFVQRNEEFQQSFCYKFCEALSSSTTGGLVVDEQLLVSGNPNASLLSSFNDFMSREFSETWFSQSDDFVSLHREDTFDSSETKDKVSYIPMSNGTSVNKSSTTTGITQYWSYVLGEINTRFARIVARDTLLGRRVSAWLRQHYGADVSNTVFENSNNVGSSTVQLNVNDIFSTSDTSTSSGEGEVLGAYAGKGLGFGQNGFTYQSNGECGYIIVLSTVVPVGGYYQGCSTDLDVIDRDTFPQPDYDTLGYEVTPYYDVSTDNDVRVLNDTDTPTSGFGFVPRYSGYKYQKNIVNGDISRRGSEASLQAYHLDRQILRTQITAVETDTPNTYKVDVKSVAVPRASVNWRYPVRYPWIGNFNRIFYQAQELWPGSDEGNTLTDDHFILQTVFDIKITDYLKPLSKSFDTINETDNSVKEIQSE